MCEEDLDLIKVCNSKIVFVDMPEILKKENMQRDLETLKEMRSGGQDASMQAIKLFIKNNVY